MNEFIMGATTMGSAVAGLLLLRFWRRTRDRLFLVFAAAFWMLGLNWLLLAWTRAPEVRTALYVVRLAAFALILLAIIDKNRPRPRRPVGGEETA